MKITNEQIYAKITDLEKTTAMLVERSGGCKGKHDALRDEIKVWFFYTGVLSALILIIGWFIK